MAGFLFNIGAQELQDGTTVWTGSQAAIRARLVLSASGAPDKDADVMTGIGSADATATVDVTGMTGPTKSDVRDRIEYVADNVVFPTVAAIGAVNRMVFYRFVTNDADSIPIACVEMTEVTPNTGDITVTMPANGWFYTQE
jgi:hypothetical protein